MTNDENPQSEIRNRLCHDFRDFLKIGRYAFSTKKITIHLIGLITAYLIYQSILYTAVWLDPNKFGDQIWTTFGFLPIIWNRTTSGDWSYYAMWFGGTIALIVIFFTSIAVSKIAFEQLIGNEFLTRRSAFRFANQKFEDALNAQVFALALFAILSVMPIVIGLLSRIDPISEWILAIAVFFLPLGFLLGLLMAYLAFIFVIGFLFSPAIVVANESDFFETLYQLMSMIWNCPLIWICYQILTIVISAINGTIFVIFSFAGLFLVTYPVQRLKLTFFDQLIAHTKTFFGIQSIQTINSSFMLKFTGGITAIGLLIVFGVVIAYTLSMINTGCTMTYILIRKKIDGTDLIAKSQ